MRIGLVDAGLAVGLGISGIVAALLHQTLRPVDEIVRYVDGIGETADGISANLAGATQLAHTQELAGALPELIAAQVVRTKGASR